MKTLFLFIALAVIGISDATSQLVVKGTGISANRKIYTKSFTGIYTTRGIHVILTQGDKQEIKVTADQAILSYVSVMVENGVLMVTYASKFTLKLKDIETIVEVTAPNINNLSAGTSGVLTINGTLNSDQLKITTSTASTLSGKINCNEISVKTNGSSTVSLSGSSKNCDIAVASAGNADMGGLVCDNASITASSASQATLTVNKKLYAKASSTAKITYSGSVTDVTKETNSLGTITKF